MASQEVMEHNIYGDLKLLHPYWGWLLFFSILLIIGGILAIAYASVTSVVTVIMFGMLLICSGVFHLFAAFFERGTKGFFLSILASLLNFFIGVWILMSPVGAAIGLTFVLATFFVLSGFVRIGTAIIYRSEINWFIVLISGLISIALGAIIYAHWPISGLWVIGLFVGIEVFMAGWTLFALSMSARRAA